MNVGKWLSRPAKWYEWWLPQSGFVGGLIAGSMLVCAMVLPKVLP